jgi:methionyl-tRNA formyltransferase
MKITVVCSDPRHPVHAVLVRWVESQRALHEVSLVQKASEIGNGTLLLLVSCGEKIGPSVLARFNHCLVLHASDVPEGRGWSPHVWAIAGGAASIVVTLLEAADPVDSGRIWKQSVIAIAPHLLWDEINELLFDAELALMDFAVQSSGSVVPCEQRAAGSNSYLRKRTPEDSRIDPNASIASQFNLIRVCDPLRFPAFFELHGHKYRLVLEKMHE